MDRFTAFVDLVDDKVWGVSFTVGGYPVPLLILLILFGGIWLTLRLGGLQLRKLPLALKYMVLNEETAPIAAAAAQTKSCVRQGVVLAFRWLYIAAVFIGPYMTVSAVWGIADIFNGLMAIPNMIALLALSGVVAAETKRYFETMEKDRMP